MSEMGLECLGTLMAVAVMLTVVTVWLGMVCGIVALVWLCCGIEMWDREE